MPDVVMPRLSDSMTEGTVVRWLHPPGTEVERGDDLVEVETDKAVLTCEADETGTLEILAPEGATRPVGAPIARLGGSAAPDPPATAATARPVPPAPDAGPAESGARPPAGDRGRSGAGTRVIASPLARRLAREHGVDLATVPGTGPGGRVVRADIEAATSPPPSAAGPAAGSAASSAAPPDPPSAAPPAPPPAPPGAPPAPPGAPSDGRAVAEREAGPGGNAGRDADRGVRGEVRVARPAAAERVVARRMTESAGIPQFSLAADIDMGACERLRSEIADLGGKAAVATYNDLVVLATARALREFPQVNAGYVDGMYERYERVNVGFAVDAGGPLLVPTVFDADRRTLGEIARTTRALAERVRSGTVTPAEVDGGTCTVSNLGMFGVAEYTALIYPPQAAILAVGEVRTVVAFEDGRPVPRRVMRATLSCDHRIVYGASAARFLARVRELLERPIALLYGIPCRGADQWKGEGA